MALSPQYGWSEPDNSSLVKNGAADIRTLGDAIDTSLWNVGYGQAGKNKLINPDFSVNQRSFTTTTTSGTYGFDRWFMFNVDGTCTYSAQTFTAGAAPVAGYEATNFARLVTTGQTLSSAFSFVAQRIEGVRTFANQTMTVSFWAKAATGTPKIAIELDQNFGSGGSTRVTTAVGQPTISTSWARYSATIAVPSISGKTIGASNLLSVNLIVSAGADFNARTGSLGIQSNTFDIWGVQAEYGSKATPFQTATGTLQGELAACQRYYIRWTGNDKIISSGTYYTSTDCYSMLPFPVEMRSTPTGAASSTTSIAVFSSAGGKLQSSNVTLTQLQTKAARLLAVTTAATAGQGTFCQLWDANAWIEVGAEL